MIPPNGAREKKWTVNNCTRKNLKCFVTKAYWILDAIEQEKKQYKFIFAYPS